jgi:hypothetical protein
MYHQHITVQYSIKSTMAYISLRNFGYSTADTQSRRRVALNTAVRVRGRAAVLDRLRFVSELCAHNDSGAVMKDDLVWLSDEDTLRLSSYGYSTKLPVLQRQDALRSAVNAVGRDKVVQRLDQVVKLNESATKKDVLQTDLDWVRPSASQTVPAVTSDVDVVRQHLRNALVAVQTALDALA